MRHQLAQAARDAPACVAPVTAPTCDSPQSPRRSRAQLVDEPREPLVERRLALVLKLGRARVRGAHEHEAARAGGGRGVDQRLERVAAEQRVGGEGVGAQAGDGAERAGRLADERLGVGGAP